ncbi:chromate transporter [Trinickia dinghuensis]|uniref:Chromate transporter n=1 Tax=Trinickia dinghuensis TaxID=2291023 RepID=A0A3D8JUQ3_9BURK|nr:chromate transporter [Trinickia dinghuensis]RDU96532.1 chromate transporter [Trinickia dinghuensis]
MILFELAWRFALVSAIAFGGATAVIPEMHRFLVVENHWINDTTFTALFAISQASPGPNVLFVALFGWQVAGLAGAIVSTLAMCGPSSVFALLFEHYTGAHRDTRWMTVFRRALAPVTIGLLMATGAILAQGADHSAAAIALTIATVAVGVSTRFNPLWLIAAGALIGVLGYA